MAVAVGATHPYQALTDAATETKSAEEVTAAVLMK